MPHDTRQSARNSGGRADHNNRNGGGARGRAPTPPPPPPAPRPPPTHHHHQQDEPHQSQRHGSKGTHHHPPHAHGHGQEKEEINKLSLISSTLFEENNINSKTKNSGSKNAGKEDAGAGAKQKDAQVTTDKAEKIKENDLEDPLGNLLIPEPENNEDFSDQDPNAQNENKIFEEFRNEMDREFPEEANSQEDMGIALFDSNNQQMPVTEEEVPPVVQKTGLSQRSMAARSTAQWGVSPENDETWISTSALGKNNGMDLARTQCMVSGMDLAGANPNQLQAGGQKVQFSQQQLLIQSQGLQSRPFLPVQNLEQHTCGVFNPNMGPGQAFPGFPNNFQAMGQAILNPTQLTGTLKCSPYAPRPQVAGGYGNNPNCNINNGASVDSNNGILALHPSQTLSSVGSGGPQQGNYQQQQIQEQLNYLTNAIFAASRAAACSGKNGRVTCQGRNAPGPVPVTLVREVFHFNKPPRQGCCGGPHQPSCFSSGSYDPPPCRCPQSCKKRKAAKCLICQPSVPGENDPCSSYPPCIRKPSRHQRCKSLGLANLGLAGPTKSQFLLPPECKPKKCSQPTVLVREYIMPCPVAPAVQDTRDEDRTLPFSQCPDTRGEQNFVDGCRRRSSSSSASSARLREQEFLMRTINQLMANPENAQPVCIPFSRKCSSKRNSSK